MSRIKYLDPTTVTDEDSLFGLLTNTVQENYSPDVLKGKTRFTAVALEDAVPINAPMFESTNAKATLPKGQFKFKARIIDEPGPHDIYPNPNDPDIAKDRLSEREKTQAFTDFYSTENSSFKAPKKGDKVLVELRYNEFGYNLFSGEYVGPIATAGFSGYGKGGSGLSGLNYGSSTEATIIPAGLFGRFFNSRGHLMKQYQPPKIAALPAELQSYAHSKGRTDVRIESNGATRSVIKTLAGGPLRSKTSLHLFGLAHDLKIFTAKADKTSTPMYRKAWLDDELMRIFWDFQTKYGVVWGGQSVILKKDRAGILLEDSPRKLSGRGTIYRAEAHHYQLPENTTHSLLHPEIAAALQEAGVTNVRKPALRKKLYNQIAIDFGIRSA